MRLRAPDTLAGRTILLMLLGLGLFHLCSIAAYQIGLETAASSSGDRQLAERMVSIKRAVTDVAAEERDQAAHRLSSASLDVHWSPRSLVGLRGAQTERTEALRARLHDLVPAIEREQIRVAYADEGTTPEGRSAPDRHMILVSMQLADESWLNFASSLFRQPAATGHGVLASTTAMALGIVLLSIIVVRWMTAPLRRLARAAHELNLDAPGAPLPEEGPREIREAAHAFNEMQARIRRLVQDRTQSLAAVSHDLKTPLTRLRLRSEFLADDELRRKIGADIDEMNAMVDSTLAFLRGDDSSEQVGSFDLAAILETLCDDLVDSGHNVALDGARHAAITCRPLAVKRAFANLLGNAVTYGERARVKLALAETKAVVTIDDDGPGIAPSDRELVFEPFHRLEASRNRDTGGSGLGLTVARAAIHGHGGEIVLENRPEGGLRVTVSMPRERDARRIREIA